MGLQKKIVMNCKLKEKYKNKVQNPQYIIMQTVTANFDGVNFVSVDKEKVTITTFTNSTTWNVVDVTEKLYKFEVPTPAVSSTSYPDKKEEKKEEKKEVIQSQDVVLKIHCDREEQLNRRKKLAMKTILNNVGIKSISIVDDSKQSFVMTFRGKADVVVGSLLELAGKEKICFRVHTVSPSPKPKPGEKKTEQKPDEKKNDAAKNYEFWKMEFKCTMQNVDVEEILYEAMTKLVANNELNAYVHSISIEGSPLMLHVISKTAVSTNIIKLITKNIVNKLELESSNGFEKKPVEKKDQENTEKKKIVLKSDQMGSEARRVMANVGAVVGLDSILIEPAEKKLLTVTWSADAVNVLKALSRVEGLRGCTTFVSVGPNKKEEPKKKDGEGGGGEKKTNNPTPHAAPPAQTNYYNYLSYGYPNDYPSSYNSGYNYNHPNQYHHPQQYQHFQDQQPEENCCIM